ncbi:hypothetical protein [Fodinicola feengrottensis]|uniref:hypothetical protein n=1 Tax=Fodinicola feengrottensis TaxID=435914 RepID=UPI002442E523|nr:hypothetical protein [Fodinicola feengrottensis]
MASTPGVRDADYHALAAGAGRPGLVGVDRGDVPLWTVRLLFVAVQAFRATRDGAKQGCVSDRDNARLATEPQPGDRVVGVHLDGVY